MIFKVAKYQEDMTPLMASFNGTGGLVKTASFGPITIEPGSDKAKIIEAELKKHPTALFFRAKAIKADEPNSNGDYFSEDELKRSYKSFEGVPFFTNHDNQNVENARGKIIFAEWVPEEKAVYTISFVDREAFPHICRSIEEEYITGVSMGALSGNSLITMADLSEKKISNVNEGDIVKTAYGNNKRIKMVHSEYLGKSMYQFDLTTYHKSPLFTNDHPIYMLESNLVKEQQLVGIKSANDNKYNRRMGYTAEYVGQDIWRDKSYSAEFKHADQIQEEDYLLIPSKFDIKDGASDNSDLYYVIGAYLGDGYLKKDRNGGFEAVSFCFGKDEIELAGKVTAILKKYTQSNPCEMICEERNGLYINYYDRKLAKWLYDNFGTGSKDKRIKLNIDKKEDAINLLAGYLDTDGCVSNKRNSNHTSSIQFSSANIGLLEDVQSILISLGAVSRISTFARTPSPNSVVKINTIENTLSVGSTWSNLFKNSIKHNFNNCVSSKINAGRTFITKINDKNYMACPVKSVSIVDFNEPVYDITVEDDECYIADGVAVHNCSVEYSVCNICGNRAEKTEDYCSHIRERKGRSFTGKAKDVRTGQTKEFKNQPVFEYNYGIKFIELSAVVDPACPSCRIQSLIKNDDLLKKVASVQNDIYMYKSASLFKEAGQQEIQQLNQVLQTLEAISIELIKNRQQVEVEFASDLVNILSELQSFVDELVGAGYGSVQGGAAGIPGVSQPPAPEQAAPPSATNVPQAMPVAAETPAPVGNISGAPGQPLVQAPSLPISAPAKPKAFDEIRMQKIAGNLITISERFNNTGEEDMANRRTLEAKNKQKQIATKVLSNSWKEKQYFFEYINRVPSVQDNNHKLSIKKKDDSFVVVAETKDGPPAEMIWTYETLTNDEKDLIQRSPKEAAAYFLNRFAGSLKINKKQGETVMASNNKEAGAKSVNKTPEVITEKQLEESGLYHSRTDDPKNVITEKQLDESRSDNVEEVITEAQLAAKSNKLNPRTEEQVEVITEAQLKSSDGASPRTESPVNVVTQSQLDPNRTDTDTDVITERQLDSVDAPWARSANRDAKLFKSAGDHMKSVVNVMADTVIATGCTPEEACKVASSLIGSTKDRFELGNAILDKSSEEEVDYSKRLAYWSKKNIKVASVGSKEIAQSIVSGLRKVASDVTINPDTVIDALDVVSESKDGETSVSAKVDEKLAAAAKEIVKVSKKDELRKALHESLSAKTDKVSRDQERKEIVESITKEDQKTNREAERAVWNKVAESKKNDKNADTMIEASLGEIGCKKDDPNFKTAIKSFARGALAAKNVKLAAITNVTISGDTISIAVQTDAGEEGIEIPVGDGASPAEEEVVPEGDLSGEGLGASLDQAPAPMPAPAPAPVAAGMPMVASAKKTIKTAQTPAGGGMPSTPGGVAAPGAPEAGGLPGGAPTESPVGSLTTDDPSEVEDEIPTAGEQQPPWAICPECGSSDVDVSSDESGNGKGACNNCGAEYEALVKKEIEFKITKPTRSVGKEETSGAPEVPEVPALPVAAQTKLNKGSLTRIASNKEKHGHVCPACGMKQLKVTSEKEGHTEFGCPACGTQIEKDVMINVNSPDQSYLRVKWDLVPKVAGCKGCEESVKKFASMVKIQNMMKKASGKAQSEFPMANCIERLARKYGGNTVASFGPCKGKALADCVCGQLEKLGMTKVRHMERLAEVYTQKDPMDECIQDQMKKNYSKKEASTICNCLKKKFASKEDSNVFLMAFASDIKSGKEKILTAQDMDAINDVFSQPENTVEEDIVEEDIDIGDALPETVSIEVSKETAAELANAAQSAVPEEVEVEVEMEPEGEMDSSTDDVVTPEEKHEPVLEKGKAPEFGVKKEKSDKDDSSDDCEKETSEKEKEMATAMRVHKILRVGEEVIKVAATPQKVEDIEGNVEAGVPRGEAKMGEESKADSMINKTLAKPSVPRGDAYMGKEKEADSLINKELKLPDVAVDSAYMGVNEKSNQSGMPAINNEIKGTVIAKEDKTVKEAKKMKEVDTVEGDVEAGVPRSKATMGKEGPDNIDVKMDKPDVPRAKATMGKEGPDNIDVKMDSPDVPIDSAYMGKEKEVQKDMPAINDEILKNVKQSRELQLERIASARRMKAVEVTAKLLATARITEEAYENVIEALSKFEIDKIASVADSMYPKIKRQAMTDASKETYAGPAIVMESKGMSHSDPVVDLAKKIASNFTIGNKSFDENLTRFGDK